MRGRPPLPIRSEESYQRHLWPSGCSCPSCQAHRLRQAELMKRLRVKRIEEEMQRVEAARRELLKRELRLYGPSSPSSSLNPELWLTVGGER